MIIIEKYVVKSYIAAFIFCVTLLMFIGMIGDILGFLDEIFKKGIPLISILSFYFYFAPFAFVNMVPFGALISAVYVFNTLSKNHEVSAVITSGISLWKLVRPVLLATFIICLFTMIVNEKMVPQSMAKANRIKQEELQDAKREVVRNIALYGKNEQIIFARSLYPKENTLEDIIIHKQDSDHVVIRKIHAKSAKWTEEGFWQGHDVMIFNIDEEGEFSLEPEIYKTRELPIKENSAELAKSSCDPKLMNYRDLKKYIHVMRISSPSSVRRMLVDLNYKLVFPFTAIITVLVGIPFSIATGRANALAGMARGISIAMIYLPLMAVSLALGNRGAMPPAFSAWISYIIFMFVGVYFVNKKS